MHTFPCHPAVLRVGLALASVMLAGCTSFDSTASVGVSSPPPPVFGSAPIAAHDDYARTLIPSPRNLKAAVAQAGNH